jgi:DNA-binding XRE family transcriptional regulator
MPKAGLANIDIGCYASNMKVETMERKFLYATAKLKQLRNEKKLRQTEMADVLEVIMGRNVSLSTYQKIEQGQMKVTIDNAMAIARALDVRMREIWRQK